jgi:hypothetical protein
MSFLILFYNLKLTIISEYATVGYMAKRIQMRKNRFLAIQKIAEQKKIECRWRTGQRSCSEANSE